MEVRIVRHTDRFDETLRFYTDALGWALDRQWAEGGRGCLIVAGDGGDARVELLETDSTDVEAVSGVFISVQVADAAAAADRLAQRGAPITQPLATQPWGHRNVSTVDPAGLPITLFEVLD